MVLLHPNQRWEVHGESTVCLREHSIRCTTFLLCTEVFSTKQYKWIANVQIDGDAHVHKFHIKWRNVGRKMLSSMEFPCMDILNFLLSWQCFQATDLSDKSALPHALTHLLICQLVKVWRWIGSLNNKFCNDFPFSALLYFSWAGLKLLLNNVVFNAYFKKYKYSK